MSEPKNDPDSRWYWDEERVLCELDGGGRVIVRGDRDGLTAMMPLGDGGLVHLHINEGMLAIFAQHWLRKQGIQYWSGRLKSEPPKETTADDEVTKVGEP